MWVVMGQEKSLRMVGKQFMATPCHVQCVNGQAVIPGVAGPVAAAADERGLRQLVGEVWLHPGLLVGAGFVWWPAG